MTRLTEAAKGVYTIAVTPFLPDGAVDYDSIDSMVDFYVEKGASGLTILGIMGEAGKLAADESRTVIDRVLKRTDLPVIVGVSAPGLASIKALGDTAMELGAAGVMVAPPATLKTDAMILNYYRDVAEALGDTPFVLQDFPLVTNVQIDPKVILQIIEDCPTCVMLKHEDWPGLAKISALRAASDAGSRRISILCGNGGQFLPEEMARGADGAMTGFAYPEMMAQVIAAYDAGDTDRAHDLFDAYLPVIRFETQPGLGLPVRKYILAKRGAIAHPTVRKPGAALSGPAVAEVDHLMARLERRLAELG
ncbi:MAG: dihydrodipicolinate synthase family protein [Rhodobacteraceae bacterium]|nr:dihydrodipicolinate synthase family protein [Paracoccaceae bacterium]